MFLRDSARAGDPSTLIEAGAVRNRKLTSWPSLRTDLINAGAQWVDQEVVVDHRLVTSRKPDDIPAFNRKIIELFAGAPEQAHRAAVRSESMMAIKIGWKAGTEQYPPQELLD